MPTRQENVLKTVEDILKNEYEEGYKDGMGMGWHSARHIFLLWSSNHQLIKPHSIEELTKWSEAELKKLEERFRKEKTT